MKKTKQFIEIIESASELASENFNNANSKQNVQKQKELLIERLQADKYIKIPFVGDFSTGKSSLINSILGQDLLPTDINPETGAPYELYYSDEEYIEHWKQNQLLKTSKLSDIKSLKIAPGHLVKVFVNNTTIHNLNNKGIVIVDMPGIDSGIQTHNDAILNYIQEGTSFVIFSDAEQGGLRQSAITFINEIKQYQLSASIVISKADKKNAEELKKIRDLIQKQAEQYIGVKNTIGVTSSHQQDYNDLVDILNTLNSEELISKRYSNATVNFINQIINELEAQLKLTLSSNKDYSLKIEKLQSEKKYALSELKNDAERAQTVEDSCDDILSDIKSALNNNISKLSNILYSKNNQEFDSTILSIIRPVITNSFKREITEFQDVFNNSINKFSINIDDILKDGIPAIINNNISQTLNNVTVESFLKKGVNSLILKMAPYKSVTTLLRVTSLALGPITIIIMNLLPDVIKMIFNNKDKELNKIRERLYDETFPQIINAIRPEIENMLIKQRDETQKELEQLITSEIQKFDNIINEIKNEEQKSKDEINKRVIQLQNEIAKANNLLEKTKQL